MRYISIYVYLILFVAFTVACSYPLVYTRDKLSAEANLSRDLSELPMLPEFARVTTVRRQYENIQRSGRICFLSRGHIVLGSWLPQSDALEMYYEEVQKLGWQPRKEQYPNSRVLHRAKNELMVIDILQPGVEVRDAINYAELLRKYSSVVFVGIDYNVPANEDCY